MFTRLREWIHQWKQFKGDLKASSRIKYWIAEGLELVVTVLPVVLLVRAFVVQTSVVPSPSMVPTLNIGDRLFVVRFSYWFSDPQRGDIVVFKSEDGRDFVKRAVGVPGDTVRIEQGDVYVNDKLFIVPGVHVQRDNKDMDAITLSEGNYIVLGDNRPQSSDSRYWGCQENGQLLVPRRQLSNAQCWGFVERSQFKGKAWFTFWPLTRMKVLR